MIGRRLQQYLIVDRAGEGGMGVVWKARDTRLDRDVALKVISERILDDNGRERFAREAKSASALNHPNIVTIYEIDSDAGVAFIAMEFIAGRTLAQRLSDGRLDIPTAVAYATQIADALACAHAAGIVHRDLKPGNIMITASGSLKVLDFGLAKTGMSQRGTAIADTPTVAPLTVAGSPVGTPDYMSPEQALGDPVDTRSDIFSFGVVIYEMLTGVRPFRSTTRSELLRQLHLGSAPSVRSLRPDVPPGLAAIVATALATKPDDRYASVTEMREALARLGPVAEDAEPASRVHMPRRRLVLGVGALVVVLGVASWVGYRQLSRSGQSGVAAVADAALPESPYALTQRAAQLLQRHDRSANVDSAIQSLEEALERDQNYAPANAYLSEAYRRRNAANPDPQWGRLAAEGARRAVELNPDLAIAQTAQGFVDYDAGRYTEAEAHWRRAIELDPQHPMPHLGLGMGFAAQQRDQEAEAALKEAVKRRGTDWRPDSELGSFYIRRGRYADAAASWEAARALAPDSTIIWRNLGAAYFQQGRYDEAATAFQRALEIAPTAATYTNLGTLRFYQGRYHDAVPAFEKAVELGANRSLYWGNLADAYRWAPGRRGDSLAAYERAIALLREDVGRQPAVIELRTRLATYLVKSNQAPAALDLIKEVEREPTLTSQVLIHITMVHELSKNRSSALTSLERAVKAGYPINEVSNEPEFTALRADPRYHRLVASLKRP